MNNEPLEHTVECVQIPPAIPTGVLSIKHLQINHFVTSQVGVSTQKDRSTDQLVQSTWLAGRLIYPSINTSGWTLPLGMSL